MGDVRMLQLLFELKTRPQYEHDKLLRFTDVMCIADLKARDPTWQWEPHLMLTALGFGGGDLRMNLVAAVHRGNVDEIQWLHERSYAMTAETADSAAAAQRPAVLAYLYAHTTARAIDEAAWGGHLPVVRFLHAHLAGGCTPQAMNGAALRGYLDVVQFLHENRREGCTPNAMNGAAARGHLSVVQFLHENRREGCS
ncbi:hypothetical protein PybrP1_009462, partial [[Pythium] brassicae (nom. inval.)]